MQIRNDYTSFQNRNYQESHTHHVTECLKDDQVKQKEGAFGADEGEPGVKSSTISFSKDGDTYRMSGDPLTVQNRVEKSEGGIFKDFWDALGEETSGKKENTLNLWRDHLLSGIHGAAASIRDMFHHQVVERVQSVPVKVKAVLRSAGARLRRGEDAFSSLTDGQTPSGKNDSAKERRKSTQAASARKESDAPMKVLRHSHLMDSYSRTGEYCQLNDNLTYGKNKSGRKMPVDGTADQKEMPNK